MFEQSLYDTQPAAPPPEEGDLFHGYELKSWDMGPRVYKIFAIAGIANILALLIAGSTPLLTMKGCDSPLVSTVCQALDTVVLGAQIFGTEREYVDAAYDKMDLSDADVTFVDVSGEVPPLSYPEGYFALANPEQFQTTVEQPADPFGATSSPFPTGVPYLPPVHRGGSLLDTKPIRPKKNNAVVEGDLPDAIGSTAPAKPGKPAKGKPGASPSPSPDDTTAGNAKPKVDPTAPVSDVELNKRPFVDLGNMINDLMEKKQVSLDSPFIMTAKGKLGKDGRLDQKSFKVVRLDSADPKMKEVILEAIKALDASGYLQYLSMVNVKDVSFIIQQDDANVTAFVESEFDNDLRPKTVSTVLNGLINTKKAAKEAPGASQNDKDDLILLQNASATANQKKLVISFSIPKTEVQRMVQRKLAEQKLQPKPQQQNNNVSGRGTNNTAVRE